MDSQLVVKLAAPLKPPEGTMLAFTSFSRGRRLAYPGLTTEARDSQKRNPDRLIFSPPLLSQDAASLWTCVWHPPMQQQPEVMQRRQLLIPKTSQNRKAIPDIRAQGIVYRLQVWTAAGRPHPSVTRTLQCEADIASCRNGQQMSARALLRRWKHELGRAHTRR